MVHFHPRLSPVIWVGHFLSPGACPPCFLLPGLRLFLFWWFISVLAGLQFCEWINPRLGTSWHLVYNDITSGKKMVRIWETTILTFLKPTHGTLFDLKKKKILMCGRFACMCVYVPHWVPGSQGGQKRASDPRNWSYRQLEATCGFWESKWVLKKVNKYS